MFSHNVLDPFNCACSLQIMLTQIPNMLGVSLPAYYGLNKHIMMLILLFSNITSINWKDTLFAMLSASVIIGFREFLQPALFRKVKLVIPTEFIVMVVATILAYCFDLNGDYGITILGDMPSGIPYPSVPNFQYMPYPLLEGFLAGLVSIAFVMQAGKVLARKASYEVSSNQELAAVGCANFFSSFFSCFPASVTVGRNFILESMGSQSQLSTVFGCLVTGLLLAFASQTLFYCPFSVIATIITLTLAMSLKMFGDLPRLYRSSKLDAVEWLLTFIACVLLDVEWGLLLGLVFSWFAVVYRSQRPRLDILGKRTGYDALYVSMKHAKPKGVVAEIPEIRIVQILNNSLHFANAEHFLRRAVRLANGRPQDDTGHSLITPSSEADVPKTRVVTVDHLMQIANSHQNKPQNTTITSTSSEPRSSTTPLVISALPHIRAVIVDLTNVSSVDSTGLRALEQLASDLKKNDKQLWISRCRERHLHKFEKYGLLKFIPRDHVVPEVHDAVLAILQSTAAAPETGATVDETQPNQTFWEVAGAQVEGLEHGDSAS
ncbi:sulfate anion transporter 1-like isoform X2 [Paramacrobiotus metropolitanus]|nr:sulfate anion transporter 1-like isoform X2 [Paramacrobiotus metropolitanus]